MSWFGMHDGFDDEMQNAPDIFARKPLTNYDRIISKTPEKLAEFLWSIGSNPATGNYYLNGKLLFSCADGNGWLDWLKQEAGEK